MKICSTGVFVALIVAACWPGRAPGQSTPVGAVKGHGTATLRRLPEALRLEVRLLAKGEDYRSALAGLRRRGARARALLVDLGAAEDSIEFGDPMIVPPRIGLRLQGDTPMFIESEPLSPLPPRGEVGKAEPGPAGPPVGSPGGLERASPVDSQTVPPASPGPSKPVPPVVAMMLKADLPLKASGPEEVILTSFELREKLKAADLNDIMELGVSMQDLELPYCGACGTGPGDPSFLFVSRISAEDWAKLLAEAFRIARVEAGQLARAAGAELGPLQHLEASRAAGPDPGAAPISTALPAKVFSQFPARANEAIGEQPGSVTFRASVDASFTLRTPTGESESP